MKLSALVALRQKKNEVMVVKNTLITKTLETLVLGSEKKRI